MWDMYLENALYGTPLWDMYDKHLYGTRMWDMYLAYTLYGIPTWDMYLAKYITETFSISFTLKQIIVL
jgi:hypothetical protein